MKKPIDVFEMDMKQLIKSPFAWLIVLILTVLPALFVWYDLSANKDPFQQTQHMKIGVVNEDQGTQIQKRKVNISKEVEQQLKSQHKWDWQFVDRQTADKALKQGDYVAVLYIPQTFSKDVTGIIRQKPKQTTVTYHVNEKVNAITPKLTDATMVEAIKQADASFNRSVMKVLLDEANQQGIHLEDQLPSYQKIRDSIAIANETLPKIEQFKQSMITLDQQLNGLEQHTATLQQADQYKNEAMAATQNLNQVHQQNLATYGPVLSGQANDISVITGQLNEALPPLFNQYDTVRAGLENNEPGAREALHELAQSLERDLPSVENEVAEANKMFETLDKDNTLEHIVKLMRTDLKKQAGVASNPIHIDRQSQFSVENFQSGITPFVTSLGLWLGIVLTILIIPTRHAYDMTPETLTSRHHFLGRLGIYTFITCMQFVAILVALIGILNISMQSHLLFIGMTMYIGLMYMLMIYSIVTVFGKVGKMMTVLLLAFQFVGTDGLFPINVSPLFVQHIQPYLPFYHSFKILREAVGGVVYDVLITETAWLGLYGLIIFIVAFIIYPWVRRPYLRRIEKRGRSKLFKSSL